MFVAAIAAVISYQHVVALAIRYGQPPLAAYLLRVSIDGLVAVSATMACDVGYGVAHGWPGALLSGWPAVAFVVAAEVAITMTRRKPSRKVVAGADTGQARTGRKATSKSAAKA